VHPGRHPRADVAFTRVSRGTENELTANVRQGKFPFRYNTSERPTTRAQPFNPLQEAMVWTPDDEK